ncbi:hypothetical protein [Klebsiella oxytoca]
MEKKWMLANGEKIKKLTELRSAAAVRATPYGQNKYHYDFCNL